MSWKAWIALTVASLLAPLGVNAADNATAQGATGATSQADSRQPQGEGLDGHQLGPFLERPQAALSTIYDSSIFATTAMTTVTITRREPGAMAVKAPTVVVTVTT